MRYTVGLALASGFWLGVANESRAQSSLMKTMSPPYGSAPSMSGFPYGTSGMMGGSTYFSPGYGTSPSTYSYNSGYSGSMRMRPVNDYGGTSLSNGYSYLAAELSVRPSSSRPGFTNCRTIGEGGL
jgi:hypothetical protein